MNSPAATAGNDRLPAAEWGWAAAGALCWTLALAGIPPTLFEGFDFSRFCEPVLHLLSTSLLNGEMPWWNPYSSLGRPFAADMQTASFYPTTYLSVFFGIKAGWALATAAHGMLVMLGFAGLMQRFGVTRPAARWGGAVFLFSAPLLARMQAGQVPYVYALCYLPLVLWFAGRLATTPTSRNWAALALAWGLQLLCSHPQVSWISALGAGAFVTGLLLRPPWYPALRAWLRTAIALVAACAVGTALIGFVVIPFIELIGQSDRALPSLAFSANFPMARLHWLSLISDRSSVYPINWEYNLHAGVVPLIGGLVALTRWRDAAMRGVMLMMGIGLVISVGEATPLFAVLFKILPGLSNFRFPARAGVLVMLGLIIGATVLAGTTQPGRRGRHAVMLAGLLIAAVVFGHYSQRMPAEPDAAFWFLGRLTLVAAAIAGWCLWLERTPGETGIATWGRRLFLPGVLVGELCATVSGLKHLPARPAQFPTESTVLSAIHAHHLDRQIAPVRVCVPPALLRENSGMIHHYSTVTGFESLSLDRVWNYLRQTAGANAPHAFAVAHAEELPNRADRFDSVNLSVLQPSDSGVLTVATAPDPRAYVTSRFTIVADASAAVARMVAGHPFHEDALVEPPWAGGLTLGLSSGSGSATITHFTLNSLEVAVDSSGAALLVVAEAWYPGWRASISGQPVVCLPVNGWMRGVPVPAGRSTVRFVYHQNGFIPGLLVSLLAAVTLGWAARSRPVLGTHPETTNSP